MSISKSIDARPLRLWPGVVLATLQVLGWFVLPRVLPDQGIYGLLAAFLSGVGIVVWWVFFSRAPWSERLGAVVLTIVAIYVTSRQLHVSVANAGMGMLFFILGPLLVTFALVVGAAVGSRLGGRARRAVLCVAILLACGVWTLVRTNGIIGAGGPDFAWRWSPTAEERLLAQANDEPPMPPPPAPPVETAKEPPVAVADTKRTDAPLAPAAAKTPAEWPGFRGPDRDGIIRGVRIETDWSASPPVQMWRRPIGPGWSSFAVHGDLLYTQEQRGPDELVSSYKVTSGEPVWRHRDAVRFWESNGGAGPRATPTLSNGRVYTLGATGIVNSLDEGNGRVVWSRNAATDTGAKVPEWGFSGSPLVVDDVVIVATSGRLVAYNLNTGEPQWTEKTKGGSYSSPHRMTIDGVTQVVMLNGVGATSVAPSTGTVLWEHAWQGGAIVQPALIADGDIVINSIDMMGGIGTRRIAVKHQSGGWTVQERWTSNALKPYYNDFVIHKGHAFGFDGSILACISLEDGKRKWKGGRYGNGQLVLLPDQDLLIVLSEEGQLALVGATPDQFKELARFPAVEGKTWNHPVLVGNVLLVRNGEEMAAFRLSVNRGQ